MEDKMVPRTRTWNCAICQVEVSGSSLCGGCRKVAYCGKEHQVQDRAAHKSHCFFPFTQKGGKEVTQVLQFDISVLPHDIKPRIWRRIQVPKNFNFSQFHKAIQIAFDWSSVDGPYHMHQFMFDGRRDVVIGINGDYDDDSSTTLDEKKKYLKDYFKGPAGVICTYEYDFGDGWEHVIMYEGEFSAEPDIIYPLCLAGERAGIPEDSGNSPGYYRICEIIRNPEHAEYKETIEWLESQGKSDYDPAKFDPSEVDFNR